MEFEFATANRIFFGPHILKKAISTIIQLGKHPLIVTGKNTERAAPLIVLLTALKMKLEIFPVSSEPTTRLIVQGVKTAREHNCDMVISGGGGSAIDAGKAIAALIPNTGDLFDYLEVIGKARPMENRPLPFVAIPTTAGTGSEVTRNAVITSIEHRVKVSLRNYDMLANIAVVDPVLTYSLPPAETANTGLDAFTQVLEPFVSRLANPLTDGFCRQGLSLVSRSLLKAYEDGNNTQAREDMSLASLLGGLALANAKLGAVHGFAGPIGGMFPAPHGAVCASLLPHVMEANVRALNQRNPASIILSRYYEIARIITGKATARARDGVKWIHKICQQLGVPKLRDMTIKQKDLPQIVKKAKNASSMKGNPIKLTDQELLDILKAAF